jgi:hydroxyacylglutathione hydrolase
VLLSQQLATLRFGGTNAYLFQSEAGYLLIDTGYPYQRALLERELERLGCRPGNLKLIVLTHGDIDHTGSCAYLREKYHAPIAMHAGDTVMCLKDGVTRDRGKLPPDFPPVLILWFIASLFGFLLRRLTWRQPYEPFAPDLLLEDGQSLAEHGFNLRVLYTPGHSQGSISLLTEGGDLVCGDLFVQVWGHLLKAIDAAGLARLKVLNVRTVYPGHGEAFALAAL